MKCSHCDRSFRVSQLSRYVAGRKESRYPVYKYECWINTFINGRRLPSCIEMVYVWKVNKSDVIPILRALGADI